MAGTNVKFTSHKAKQEKRLNSGIEKGMLKCGLRIEREAKQLCRIDTGRLAASISINWTNSNMTYGKVDAKAKIEDGISQPTDKNYTVKIGTRVDYASYVEHGTVHRASTPFLFPAYEMNIGKLPEFIKGEIPERSVIG